MHIVKGKATRQVDAAEVAAWARNYCEAMLDLGAGDGRFVRELAARHPATAAIGVDLCVANVRTASRKASENALFVIADALALPAELRQMATSVTINFPWGSLLRGLLNGDPGLLSGLIATSRPGALVQMRLNAGALEEEGWTLESGADRVVMNLAAAGLTGVTASHLARPDLRRIPTTWARKLAFGRDPRAVQIEAMLPGDPRYARQGLQ